MSTITYAAIAASLMSIALTTNRHRARVDGSFSTALMLAGIEWTCFVVALVCIRAFMEG